MRTTLSRKEMGDLTNGGMCILYQGLPISR